jgi:hypothetical protein
MRISVRIFTAKFRYESIRSNSEIIKGDIERRSNSHTLFHTNITMQASSAPAVLKESPPDLSTQDWLILARPVRANIGTGIGLKRPLMPQHAE